MRHTALLLIIVGMAAVLTMLSAGPAMAARHGNHSVVVVSPGFNTPFLGAAVFHPTSNTAVVVSTNNARFGCSNGTNLFSNIKARVANFLMQQGYLCTGRSFFNNNLSSVGIVNTTVVGNPINNTAVVVSTNNASYGCSNGTNLFSNIAASAADILMQRGYVCGSS